MPTEIVALYASFTPPQIAQAARALIYGESTDTYPRDLLTPLKNYLWSDAHGRYAPRYLWDGTSP
jgi:hypothetical protein